VQANIREQCSWAHTDKPKEATEKAVRLVRGAINKTRYSEALERLVIPATNAVMIIGAGVTGMRAAVDLADMGTEVILVEKSHFIGGRAAQMGSLFSTDENGEEIVTKLYNEIKKRENIKLFTGSRIKEYFRECGQF